MVMWLHTVIKLYNLMTLPQQQSGVRLTSWNSRTWKRSIYCPAVASPSPSTTHHLLLLLVYTHTHLSRDTLFFNGDSQNVKEFDQTISGLSLIIFCAGSASAVEMVALLVQNGLFDCAVSVCQTFKLSLAPVFEGLTFKWVSHLSSDQRRWGSNTMKPSDHHFFTDASSFSLEERRLRTKPGTGWLLISCHLSSTPKSPGILTLFFSFSKSSRWCQNLSNDYNWAILGPVPQTRPGDCWPPTSTLTPLLMPSTTTVSSTNCCHMACLSLIGWSSLIRWDIYQRIEDPSSSGVIPDFGHWRAMSQYRSTP